MPFKLMFFLLRHAATGLALSTTAVIGFAYFVMLPGGDGNWAEKFATASQQLMQISHLLFPLVILIGLSFGLGLLHNHSEIVQLMQLAAVRTSLAAILFLFMLTTVLTERLLWPQLEAEPEEMTTSEWVKSGRLYVRPTEQAIFIQKGRIAGFNGKNFAIGEGIPEDWTDISASNVTEETHWLTPPASTKAQYAWWQQWHQALWPAPLFWLLWQLLKRQQRGSSAASLTGSLAGLAIASGLLAEAIHIVLNKALAAPPLTLWIPLGSVVMLTAMTVLKKR